MNKNFTLKKWAAESTGVSVTVHGISIHAELYGQESNGILLYDSEDAEPVRIDFTDEMKLGSTYRCLLSGSSLREYTYLFHEDGKPVTDLLAKRLSGHRYFGEEHLAAGKKDALKRCVFVADQFHLICLLISAIVILGRHAVLFISVSFRCFCLSYPGGLSSASGFAFRLECLSSCHCFECDIKRR